MRGHIELDGRPYMLKPLTAYRRYPANQMAPKLGQGSSQYRDLTSWEAWIGENWQQGVGAAADEEGYLYGEVESRVANQLILPPLLTVTDSRQVAGAITDLRRMPGSVSGTLTIGGSGNPTRAAILIDASASYTVASVWFYMQALADVGVTVAFYDVDANDKPTGAAKSTATISPVSYDYGYRWYRATTNQALTAKACIVVYPTDSTESITLACGGTYTNAKTWTTTDGSTWTADTARFPYFLTSVHKLNNGASVADVVRFNGVTYAAAGNQLYKYSTVNGNWTAVGAARAATITDLEVWGANLYIALGIATNHDTMSTAEVYTAGTGGVRLWAASGGYLWKATDYRVYYSADGSTWSNAIAVGSSAYSVRGLAEVGQSMYAATDDGLFLIAPGDVAVGVTPWGGPDANNGRLRAQGGLLYARVRGQLLQINEGTVRNLWTLRRDELPPFALGQVADIAAMTNWMVALVNPASATGLATVWAWQEQGWHFLAQLPQGLVGNCIRYDRATQKLWIGTTNGLLCSIYVSDYVINPFYDTAMAYQPFGWLETDWFSAGILEAQKDIESLYLRLRSVGSTRRVDAYWQDDTSSEEFQLADETGDVIVDENGDPLGDVIWNWQYLGRFDSERMETVWDNADTRPNTKELRLGFLFSTDDYASTPKLEGFRLKYHPMIKDWFAWSLPVAISGRGQFKQQLVDGDTQAYDAGEQIAHLDTLVTRVPPLTYVDIDGQSYDVKVKDGSFSPENVEWYDDALVYDGVYNLTVEAVRAGANA